MPVQKKIRIFAVILTVFVLFSGIDANRIVGSDYRYSTALDQWEKQGLKSVDGVTHRVTPSDFIRGQNSPVLIGDDAFGYADGAILMRKGDTFAAEIDLPSEGLYSLEFDYFILSDGLQTVEFDVQVNGNYPFFEAGAVGLPPLWKSAAERFPKDRFGNEVMPSQMRAEQWQTTPMLEPGGLNQEPMLVKLNQGINRIQVTLKNGELLCGSLTVSTPSEPISYPEYAKLYADAPVMKPHIITREAETPDYRNDTTINAVSSRDLDVVPYDTNSLLLNTLGGKTWTKSGQTVYYDIEIEQSGLYQIAVKYKQSVKQNARVFRTFTVDNRIPFREASQYPFDYSSGWQTEVLNQDKEPFLFYLSEGKHRIGIMADAGPHYETIRLLRNSLKQANDLDLEVRKLVGNDVDRNRDWEITDYFPTIHGDLLDIANALKQERRKMVELNNGVESAKGLTSMQMAINTLEKLADEPNLIPRRLKELNGGSGSVTQSLSLAMQEFEYQPLFIDQIYISTPTYSLPEYETSWFRSLREGIKRFLHSFAPIEDGAEHGKTLTVWMNRPRNYMEVIQQMADEQFTAKTGVKVNFSTLPNEQRLTLASSSGTAPDIALGISNGIPFELGIRGAALDLRQFEDFPQVIEHFSPGAFLPLMVKDQVFGLPETQDFYVLFYRKDILDSLNIPVPDTWDDVLEILPELQRYGMNFYSPIASPITSTSGGKPFIVTAPFIYQFGGDLFGKDAFETGIDKKEALEGIQLMTDLFKLYGLPMQVPNFFEHFRSGAMPIGISNFRTYVQMQIAAPELSGYWKIAPAPGIRQDGETVRWAPGSAQVAMIFKETEYPDESWEFLKWWMSEETQVRFANQLQTLYGKEFLWITANTAAFQQQYILEEDKQVILKQWKWLKEVPKTLGSYMTERELGNIWLRVVIEGENIRSAVEQSVNEINKEISRKMEEFGYMKDGQVVEPYPVATIEDVEGWVIERDGR